jgi:N utilization substance protein A
VQIVDPEERRLEVIVEDTQLSLAIGKKGQNVRLASKLIGWNIDIKSEEEKRREIEAQMTALTSPGTSLTELQGVGPKTIEKLESHGISSIEKLADMTPEQLVEIPGIGEKMVEKIHQSVALYFEGLEAQQAAEAAAEISRVAAESAEASAIEAAPVEVAPAENAAPAEAPAEEVPAEEPTADELAAGETISGESNAAESSIETPAETPTVEEHAPGETENPEPPKVDE